MRFKSAFEIASDICVGLGDHTLGNISIALRSVGRAIVDLSPAFPSIKSEIFEVPSNLVLVLPDTSGVVTKVGVINDFGQLMMLHTDSKLRVAQKNALQECDPPEPISDNVSFLGFCEGDLVSTWHGRVEDLGGLGTYRHNKENQTIEFGGTGLVKAGSKVIVEYQSHDDQRFLVVPEEAQAMVEARALYFMKVASNPREANIHFSQFRTEFDQYKRRLLNKPPESYIRALTFSHYGGPK